MQIRNVKAVTPGEIILDATIHIEDSRIDRIVPFDALDHKFIKGPAEAPEDPGEVIVDGGGAWAMPGFIDTHVHGAAGADTTDRTPEALATMAGWHLRRGTTSMTLTAFAQQGPPLLGDVEALADFIAHHNTSGQWLGIHIEGPFLNPKKPGMFAVEGLLPPDKRLLMDLLRAAGDHARIMTIAPELKGAMELVETLAERGVRPALGHTEAGLDVVAEAARRGLCRATHLFNAMPPIHHREPGTAIAAMSEPGIFLELIVDGVHVHPKMVAFTVQAAGAGRVMLVTDALRATGMPDGRYRLGRQGDMILKNGEIRGDSGALAGSTLSMDAAVRNLVKFTGCSMIEAAWMSASNVARNLGIDDHKGRLAAGYDADIVLMDEELKVKKVVVMGRVVSC